MEPNPYEAPADAPTRAKPTVNRFGYLDVLRLFLLVFPMAQLFSLLTNPRGFNPLITTGLFLAFGTYCFVCGLMQGRIGKPR